MLLRPALGGNCKTVVVVNASMDSKNAIQTMQALRFGETCSQVEASVSGPKLVLAETLEQLAIEIKECQDLIKLKEKWIDRTEARVDTVTGQVEMVTTTIPVGAEAESARLEGLLQQQRAILGI